MSSRAILAACCLFLTACATRQTAPGVYRLVRNGTTPTLVPPGVSGPVVPASTLDFRLDKPVASTCRFRDDVFRVEPHRSFLRITIQREALLTHPAPWLADWSYALETRGCIPAGKSGVLAEQIVESVPLDPGAAQRLLQPAAATSGYVDLTPGFKLKVVSPILREGALPGASALATDSVSGNDSKLSLTVHSSADFLGYEISWYGVEEKGALKFVTAEAHVGDEVTTTARPRVNHFAFPDSAAAYRLFYLTRVSQADHNIAVLAAPSRAEMNRQTPAFTNDPDACEKAPPRTCVALGKEIGITLYVTVTANGSTLDVPAGSTVADVLRAAGVKQPATMLPTLAVRRNYKGVLAAVEFDRTQPDILALHVRGHEEITW